MTDVLIVLPSLARGGAERHSVLMATALDPARFTTHVLAFADGPFRADLEAAGVPVQVVDAAGGLRSVPAAARAVRRAIKRIKPDLVSTHHVLGRDRGAPGDEAPAAARTSPGSTPTATSGTAACASASSSG